MLNMTQHTLCHSERSRGISWKRKRKPILPFLALSNVAERGGAPAPERGLLLDFCKSILIRIILIIKYQSSIVTRLLPRANTAQPRRQPFWLCEPFPLSGEFTPPLGESKTILFNSAASQSTLPRDVSTSST